MRTTTRIGAVTAALTVTAIALTGCASGSASSATTTAATTAATGPAVDLSGVCPATVVVQTDWNPEGDHGHLYQMLGANPTIDASGKKVTGDLVANGKPTGVKLEVRAGGPAIGYSKVSSQMYQDKSITLGYVSTDEAVSFSDKLPTTAVFAENDQSPMVIMWDPKTYPEVDSIKSLGKALEKKDGVVRYFNDAAYMSYLQDSGNLPKSVLDGSYDGTPSKFVSAGGKDAQQGFATAEPYVYQHQVPAWGKKISSALISTTGWNPYPETMSIRSGDKTKLAPCLKALVPVMQQADVDYLTSPGATNDLITQLVQQYNNGWTYDSKVGAFAAEQMRKRGIATDGDNGYVGDMDEKRMSDFIAKATPVFSGSDGGMKEGLAPSDLYTNEFLDKSISLGF
ncbi:MULTISPECIES: ABC transporter substrate-binding protein [unclassified Curtobacterium]|uniref:ABC transporter substrate-binding protein n=1 Tax=unclassified Curtobacterium TaxID=257496 RepID=UPI000D89D9E6|nr:MULTISPECIES: ABC transporter substrate-binding protein [unclassified Curtobacterium]PYY32391.1 ABC transporter substrate-binding protein [Curtobacterium sp. MCBD17_030]PZE33364.1 ABC transporter substrate-binding protein [Curtobacterium sp. MCPF17_031]PZF13924.1 ABC transporter substrate-binding protein [Curtobacterium sp. MCPF17_011]